MVAVRVDIKRTPGLLSMLARSTAREDGVAEVYIHGQDNIRKAMYLTMRGHDPFVVPDHVIAMAKEMIRVGARSLDPEKSKRTRTAAAQYVAKWLRERITSGMLGTMRPATIRKKLWAISRGRATSAFGVPGPYGIYTGHLVRSILARWRAGRGGR